MHVALETARQPAVMALIEALDAYQIPLYPAESHHGIDLDALCAPEVLFAVARNNDGAAIGCGALLIGSEFGEIKRMFTLPASRGQGVARAILALLEAQALQRGCATFMLETGYLQPEAIGLYQRLGYRLRGPFGDYAADPNSVFMEKSAAL